MHASPQLGSAVWSSARRSRPPEASPAPPPRSAPTESSSCAAAWPAPAPAAPRFFALANVAERMGLPLAITESTLLSPVRTGGVLIFDNAHK